MLTDSSQHATTYTKNLWRALYTAKNSPTTFNLHDDRELRDISAIYASTSWPAAQSYFAMMREETDFLLFNFPLVRLARAMVRVQTRPYYTADISDVAAMVWWEANSACPEDTELDLVLVEDSFGSDEPGSWWVVHWFSMLLADEIFAQSAAWAVVGNSYSNPHPQLGCWWRSFLASVQGVRECRLKDFVSRLFVRFVAWGAARLRVQQLVCEWPRAVVRGYVSERELLMELWNAARFRAEMRFGDEESEAWRREQGVIRARVGGR
jgi:hypothetical protein